MNVSRENEIERLKIEKSELFDRDALNILNGQAMYDEFNEKQLMGVSDFVPFNEAMCVNQTTEDVFDQQFIKTRASGHHQSVENYLKQVIEPLSQLFNQKYNYIVLWFGEDMFCQMNLLTLLAYLEQSRYGGEVFLNCFKEEEFKVTQTELYLGKYSSIYNEVLINHKKPLNVKNSVLEQAIIIYLELLEENNRVTRYIAKNKNVPTTDLVQQLFKKFPIIGYGDSQYIELIEQNR